MFTLDPKTIVVHRPTRQRQAEIEDIEDLKQSIAANGIINPLIVRRVDGESVLVAGERRLKSALALGLPEVPVRFFDNLTPTEAEIIELEENLKRKELAWRDTVKAIGRIHALYIKQDSNWKVDQTAAAISLGKAQTYKILNLYNHLDDPRIAQATGIAGADAILQRFADHQAAAVVNDLITQGKEVFAPKPVAPASGTPTAPPTPAPPAPAVICANFHEWAAKYSGPKFSFIHCDFPYGNYVGNDQKGVAASLGADGFYDNTEDVYWNLLSTLTTYLDNLMSHSAHLLFWFNMNFYTETVRRLRAAGLTVHDHPIIWHKMLYGTGNAPLPGGTSGLYPKRTYDTALLASRGNRPLARILFNSYAAPHATDKIHPSQKPEPMLRYFFAMFVDETTTMLDPTCGSGAALRAAEDCGAKSVLGLELDPAYASLANSKTLSARVLRQAGKVAS